MAIVGKPQAVTVKELLEQPLCLPDYQRPYKWQDRHVNQLFDDLLHHRNHGCYRLGTVVLHRDKDTEQKDVNIVDGQQRLLTLTLLCHVLDGKQQHCSPFLLNHPFSSPLTQENLRHNTALLQGRVRQLESDTERQALLDFLLNGCELIHVTLDDLSEAFQFFDSQNARGKPLAPFDLLKAFHLREIGEVDKPWEADCVEKWEEAATSTSDDTPSVLQRTMADYLYRLRQWADGRSGREFTNRHIGVFKGVNLTHNHYRMTDAFKAVNYAVDLYNTDPARQWDQQQKNYPFQVDQTLLNGRRFFEYVRHYIELHKQLFIETKPELEEVLTRLNSYDGRTRTGDRYVRNLFECALLYYYDKYGDHNLKPAARLCFAWSYRIRLTLQRVSMSSIDNAAKAPDSLIRSIKQALHPRDVLAYYVPPVTRAERERGLKDDKIKDLLKAFSSQGLLIDDK